MFSIKIEEKIKQITDSSFFIFIFKNTKNDLLTIINSHKQTRFIHNSLIYNLLRFIYFCISKTPCFAIAPVATTSVVNNFLKRHYNLEKP